MSEEVLAKLFDSFEKNIAKILAGHVKVQRSVGPLSQRDEDFLLDYKRFVGLARRYERDFYMEMFENWSMKIDLPEFIFDEVIAYRLNNNSDGLIIINLPVIHEWGLKNVDTKIYVDGLEIVLLTIAALLHRDDEMVSKLKERLNELQPKAVSGPSGSPLSGLNSEGFQKMFGGMLNGMIGIMKENPEFKDQIPQEFNGEELSSMLVKKVMNPETIDKLRSGDIATAIPELGKSLINDPEIRSTITKMSGEDPNKPKTFAELPKELQPPGEPLLITSSEIKQEKGKEVVTEEDEDDGGME